MALLEVDGFAVLRNIGSHPDVFAALARDAARMARLLVVKQITHRDTGLGAVGKIRAALGAEAFSLIMDAMSDAQIKSLALRLDRHAWQVRAEAATVRRHLLALAEGAAQPAEKVAGARAARPRKKKTPGPGLPLPRIDYLSAGATRKR